MSLNPNATPFQFNPNAGAFVPGGFSAAPAAPAAAPAPASTSTHAQPTDEIEAEQTKVDEEVLGEGDDGGDEPIDENDPLWKAVLKIANGNRGEAVRLLADPDALMVYPEVRAVMEGGAAPDDVDDAWEKAIDEPVTSTSQPVAAATPTQLADSASSETKLVERPRVEQSAPAAEDDEDGAGAQGDDAVLGDEDPRDHMNLVFIGHVDAGKSTLSGNILYLTDHVDRRTIERYEREAKQRNRESWFLAFIMDTNEEERARGKTVEVGRAHFATVSKTYTILDAPGHKNYVPNMIMGASQADVGVLVISARRGEFETGFEKGGQTREHALLAKTLGVKLLVVVVNKMDDPTVEWSQERFDECVSKLKPFLKQCGYAIKKDVRFLPVSALTGANVKDEVSPDACPWWRPLYQSGGNNTSEATLLQVLDSVALTDRDPAGTVRLPVLDRYMERGTVAMGKVERGRIVVGQALTIMPLRVQTTVAGIQIGDKWVRTAKVGENVNVKLSTVGLEDVQRGYVLCSPEDPITPTLEFTAQLAVVDLPEHRPIFSAGYDAILHAHTICTDVTVRRLITVTDRGVEKKSRFAKQGNMVICVLAVNESVCLETFANMPQLGRFTLRDEGKTVGIGKVLEIPGIHRK